MDIPPGMIYLSSMLPFLLVPPTVTYGIFRVAAFHSNLDMPAWLVISAILLSRPILSYFQRLHEQYSNRLIATTNNAHPVPAVKSKSFDFLGFKLMKDLVNDSRMNYPAQRFGEWAEEYGNIFQISLPSDVMIMTTEPHHVKAMLATQFDSFHKGPLFFEQLGSLLGLGVFNSDGDLWKFHRSMSRPYFSRDRISHFENFEQHATDALNKAEKRLAEGYAFDLQASLDLVARFTLDSATQFLFGYDIESLAAGLSYPDSAAHLNTEEFLSHPSNMFVSAFSEGLHKSVQRTRRGKLWAPMEFWKDEIKPLRKTVETYIDPLVHQALQRTEKAPNAAVKGEDSGDTLLEDLVKQTQDVKIIKDELINLLVAGRDTTSSTLSFAFYMLTEHPHIEIRLREEIKQIVGLSRQPNADDVRDMKYLKAFINEVLRLYPPVPIDSRFSAKPTVFHSKTPGTKSYVIPADIKVLYSVFLMHRRTDLWGPDAFQFDPDRFLDDRVKYLTANPYIFLPFNAGPRICLGQQFAYQEVSYFLIRLLQRFENFRLAPHAQPEESKPPAHWAYGKGSQATEKIWPEAHITLVVKGGLWVTMNPITQLDTTL